MEQFQPFRNNLHTFSVTGPVTLPPGRSRLATRSARLDCCCREDDGDFRGRFHRNHVCRSTGRDKYGDPKTNQIGRQCLQSLIVALCPSVFDRDVLALNVTGFDKCLATGRQLHPNNQTCLRPADSSASGQRRMSHSREMPRIVRLDGGAGLRLPRPGNWNSLRYYLYVFCNCGEQHVPTFKPQMMRGKNSPRGDECWSFVLRLRASAAELDLRARSVGILKQSLKLPFHAARNAEGCGCLTAGYLR